MVSKTSLVENIVAKYGIPDRIYVDNGRAFTSKAVLDDLTALGVKVDFATPYSPVSKHLERHFADLTEKAAKA